jgi:uncharacterized protein (TIGR02266 family)
MPSETTQGREKRIFPRIPVALTAHCRIGNRFIRDAVADLSEGGLYLKTREPARAGTPVRVALALPFQDGPRYCTLVGSVARIDKDARGFSKGLGVSFEGIDANLRDHDALKGFLSKRDAA